MQSKIYENNDVLLTLYENQGVHYLDMSELLHYCRTDRSVFLAPIKCYINENTVFTYREYGRKIELIRLDIALIRLCRSQKTRFALLVHWILLTFKLVLRDSAD